MDRLPEIRLRARERPLGEVLDALAGASGWRVQVPVESRQRRVTAVFQGITGGEAVAAILEFLNRSGAVTVVVSTEQKTIEKDWITLDKGAAGPTLALRLAEELKAEIYPLMTPEQRSQVVNGSRVKIPIVSLPGHLQGKIRFYVELNAGLVASSLTSRLDWTRYREFGLNFTFFPLVGVEGVMEDGRGVSF